MALSMSPTVASSGYAIVAPIADTRSDVAHEPAREVEIVDAHVDQHAAAARGVRVLEARAKRVARRRLEHEWCADAPGVDLLLRGRVAGVEASHEAHLEERARSLDRGFHRCRLGERQRGRLLAERGLLPLDGRDHVLAMQVRGRRDHDRVHAGVVDERLRIGVRSRDIELGGDIGCQRASRVGNRDQSCFRNATCQVARVHTTQTPQPNQSYVQSAHDRDVIHARRQRKRAAARVATGSLTPRRRGSAAGHPWAVAGSSRPRAGSW